MKKIEHRQKQREKHKATQVAKPKKKFNLKQWLKDYYSILICASLILAALVNHHWPNFFESAWDNTFAATFSEDFALLKAVQERDTTAAQEALALGANPNFLDKNTSSALCLAIASNQPDILKSMLERNVRWNESNNEKAPVLVLAEKGSADMAQSVQLLLDAQFLILQDIIYFTSLEGNIPFLQFLLKTYPEFDINTTQMISGVNLIASALSFNHIKSLDFIIQHSTEDGRQRAFKSLSGEYVIPAMASENATVRASIFALHSDVNIATTDGITPLMLAATQGHVEAVQELLSRGARIDMKNVRGETALLLCAGAGQPQTLTLLLEAGAQIHERNLEGWSPLMLASMSNSVETVRLLLTSGSDVMARTHKGAPALTHAVVAGSIPITQELLKKGADINATDNDGWSALMWACIQQGPPMVQFLLDNGANPYAVDRHGFDVLRFAKNSQDEDVLDLLEDFMGNKSTSETTQAQ